jgi:ppGpp synthetase/RelA/SpoT-type nucleotidyltranferase
LVRFKAPRTQLPEYERFGGIVVEIQVRTVLQHGWAEIEHGIGYKPEGPVGEDIRDRLLEIAGALRMADREFQRIDADTKKEQAPDESS